MYEKYTESILNTKLLLKININFMKISCIPDLDSSAISNSFKWGVG